MSCGDRRISSLRSKRCQPFGDYTREIIARELVPSATPCCGDKATNRPRPCCRARDVRCARQFPEQNDVVLTYCFDASSAHISLRPQVSFEKTAGMEPRPLDRLEGVHSNANWRCLGFRVTDRVLSRRGAPPRQLRNPFQPNSGQLHCDRVLNPTTAKVQPPFGICKQDLVMTGVSRDCRIVVPSRSTRPAPWHSVHSSTHASALVHVCESPHLGHFGSSITRNVMAS